MKKLEELHPEFLPPARRVLTHIAHLAELSGCRFYIASAWRDPVKQMEIYKRGREFKGGKWHRVPGKSVLTNALPHQTPHCVTTPEGKPASMAVDIALVSDGPEGPAWLADDDPRWGIIGAAAGLSGASLTLSWGGMFRSIRDFPHLELRDWRSHVGKGSTV